jgi:hypothetical protein
VAWQFSAADHEKRERTALRAIAISFFALAAYVTFDAVRALLGAGEAAHSAPGLALAALSLLVMPFLSAAQRRAGRPPPRWPTPSRPSALSPSAGAAAESVGCSDGCCSSVKEENR